MDSSNAIAYLDHQIIDPHIGLPQDIFLFASRILPLVNVDLLIKDSRGRTLLTWRSDCYCGNGWHIPGGILRFKERLEERIEKVTIEELGLALEFDPVPITMNQCIDHDENRKERGHFISFLYRCHAPDDFMPDNRNLSEHDVGYAKWHESCPDNLINVHHIYRQFI